MANQFIAINPSLSELFISLACCDTFHDFKGGERGKKAKNEEGDSLNLSFVGINYAEFAKETIKLMYPDTLAVQTIDSIISMKNKFKDGSFENTMYRAFSTIDNEAISLLTTNAVIKRHLRSIFGLGDNEAPTFQQIDPSFFTERQAFIQTSTLIDFVLPRVLYSVKTSENIITFMKEAYPGSIDKSGKLKFVEDASAFPRDIFITQSSSNFIKIATPQSKWDSGGYSGFTPEEEPEAGEKSAYSFRTYFEKAENSAVFTPNGVKFPGPVGTMSLSDKCGPSVNHLILHLISQSRHFEEQRNKELCLRILDNPDKKKNYKFKLQIAKTEDEKVKLCKLFTTYKRTGDYENIHSAIINGAVCFTGDEPAFTYAIANKCPCVLHIRLPGYHKFRFYIPPSEGVIGNIKLAQKTLASLVSDTVELQSLFSITNTFYDNFIKNINASLSAPISLIKGDQSDLAMLGELLRYLILKNLNSQVDLNRNLLESAEIKKEIEKVIDDLNLQHVDDKINSIVNSASSTLSGGGGGGSSAANINEEQIEEINRTIQEMKQTVEGVNTGELTTKLAEIRQYIPKKFLLSNKEVYFKDSTMFKQVSDNTGFFSTGESPQKKYKFNAVALLPHYNEIVDSIQVIQKNIRLIKISDKESYRKKIIATLGDAIRDYVGDADDNVAKLFSGNTLGENLREKISELASAEYTRFQTSWIAPRTSDKKKGGAFNKNATRKNKIINYNEIYKKICKLKVKHVPYGLKLNEYAALFVERLIITDTLYRETQEYKNKMIMLSKDYVKSEVTDPSKSAVYNESEKSNEVEPLQGGGDMTHLEKEYWQGIFWDYIEPFFRKNIIEPQELSNEFNNEIFTKALNKIKAAKAQAEAADAAAAAAEAAKSEADAAEDDEKINDRTRRKLARAVGIAKADAASKVVEAEAVAAEAAAAAEAAEEAKYEATIKNKTRYYIQGSIIGMTFIDDYLCMLEEIAGSNPEIAGSIAGKPDARELIQQATSIINILFDYYSKVKNKTHYIYIAHRVENMIYNLSDIKSIFNNSRGFSNDLTPRFFNTITRILEYFEHLIIVKEKNPKQQLNELDIKVNSAFLAYMENVYPYQEPGGGAASSAAKGGSFQIKSKDKRKKRNGSPRRKSLKRR
jgi:hypothetical protein